MKILFNGRLADIDDSLVQLDAGSAQLILNSLYASEKLLCKLYNSMDAKILAKGCTDLRIDRLIALNESIVMAHRLIKDFRNFVKYGDHVTEEMVNYEKLEHPKLILSGFSEEAQEAWGKVWDAYDEID